MKWKEKGPFIFSSFRSLLCGVYPAAAASSSFSFGHPRSFPDRPLYLSVVVRNSRTKKREIGAFNHPGEIEGF